MSKRAQPNLVSRWSRGFTLLEVLVATSIFVVLVGALYSLLYGALRLRERTYEVTEAGLPKDYVALLIKQECKLGYRRVSYLLRSLGFDVPTYSALAKMSSRIPVTRS